MRQRGKGKFCYPFDLSSASGAVNQKTTCFDLLFSCCFFSLRVMDAINLKLFYKNKVLKEVVSR